MTTLVQILLRATETYLKEPKKRCLVNPQNIGSPCNVYPYLPSCNFVSSLDLSFAREIEIWSTVHGPQSNCSRPKLAILDWMNNELPAVFNRPEILFEKCFIVGMLVFLSITQLLNESTLYFLISITLCLIILGPKSSCYASPSYY